MKADTSIKRSSENREASRGGSQPPTLYTVFLYSILLLVYMAAFSHLLQACVLGTQRESQESSNTGGSFFETFILLGGEVGREVGR